MQRVSDLRTCLNGIDGSNAEVLRTRSRKTNRRGNVDDEVLEYASIGKKECPEISTPSRVQGKQSVVHQKKNGHVSFQGVVIVTNTHLFQTHKFASPRVHAFTVHPPICVCLVNQVRLGQKRSGGLVHLSTRVGH